MAAVIALPAGNIGSDDHAIRFGGEEFLLLLPNMDLPDAMRVAERARRAIEAAAIPNEGVGLRGIVTASFGVAGFLSHMHDGPAVLEVNVIH